jgi:hypothetical protein
MLEAFQQMARAGELRPGVDPDVAARSTLAVMDGLQVQWLLDSASVDIAADPEAWFRVLTTEEAWHAAAQSRC